MITYSKQLRPTKPNDKEALILFIFSIPIYYFFSHTTSNTLMNDNKRSKELFQALPSTPERPKSFDDSFKSFAISAQKRESVMSHSALHQHCCSSLPTTNNTMMRLEHHGQDSPMLKATEDSMSQSTPLIQSQAKRRRRINSEIDEEGTSTQNETWKYTSGAAPSSTQQRGDHGNMFIQLTSGAAPSSTQQRGDHGNMFLQLWNNDQGLIDAGHVLDKGTAMPMEKGD